MRDLATVLREIETEERKKKLKEGYTDDPPTGGQYSDGGAIVEPAMHEVYNTYAGVARDLIGDKKAFTFGVAMADALHKKNEIVDDDSKLATVIDAIVKGVNKRMTGIKFKVKRVEDSQLGQLNQPMEGKQVRCQYCRGKGHTHGKKCTVCKGTGIDDLPLKTYIRHKGGEGFIVGQNARGEYLVSMNKRAKLSDRDIQAVFPKEIIKVFKEDVAVGNDALIYGSHKPQAVHVGLGGKKHRIGVTYHGDIDLETLNYIMKQIGGTNFGRAPAMRRGSSSYNGVFFDVPDVSKFKTQSWIDK